MNGVCSRPKLTGNPVSMMKMLVIVLFVGSALAGTDQGTRDGFSGLAVDFFMGDKTSAKLEMIPSEDCVEGDMLMNAKQKEVYNMMLKVTAENRVRVQMAVNDAFRLWPDKTFVYMYDSILSEEIRTKFEEAVNLYREATCIDFIEAKDGYTGAVNPITIRGTDNGCYSTVGGPGGNMNLQEGSCNHIGVCLHELGHALSVYHEQTRSDRDEYVIIMEKNIKNGYAHNFNKRDMPVQSQYDYQSVMHYSSHAFSKDGYSQTIVPLDPGAELNMGRQQKLSRLDKFKFNLMYNCYDNCPSDLASQCLHGGLPSKDCTCLCPEEYIGAYCEIFNKVTECSAEYSGPSGEIMTPNYPGRYPSDSNCVYAIECQAGERIKLEFIEFDIEGWGCFYDTLEMKIGNITDEIYPDEYCDDELHGETLYSETNLALMKFQSDYIYNYNGFKLQYQCEQS